MKTKKIAIRSMFALLLVGVTRGAKVTFQPLYSDLRFQPSDQLHAGCTNSADILFGPQGQKITKTKIILSYNPESLEILRVLPIINDGSATSKIEYNRIILEIQNPSFASSTETKAFFTIFFKSSVVGKDTITVAEGSEAITANKTYPLAGTFNLEFAKVPECEPDIIPPSINLIYPKNTDERIFLDQHFIFDIKDIGKGIDRDSVIINFNNEQYFYGGEHLKWNGNYLTFYPNTWIPIDMDMELKILVADQQAYGGANKTESVYTFQSATGIALQKDISPIVFRKIAQEAQKISASVDECELLGNLYIKSDSIYKTELTSIIQKLGCSMAGLEVSLTDTESSMSKTMSVEKKHYRNVSVFGTLGRILFFVAFTLKLNYLYAYKKHKRLNREKRTPKK